MSNDPIALLEAGIERGWHRGAQLYVSAAGRLVWDVAVGCARADMLFCWLSATKPVGAVALGQLHERGRLDWDDPVARYLPAFAQHGKDRITIRHLLTHTSGIPNLELDPMRFTWEEILTQVCAVVPNAPPGMVAAYNYSTTWYLVAALVERLDGRNYGQYVREEIFARAGMTDSWIGMPAEQYRAYGPRMGVLWNTWRTPPVPQPWDNEASASVCQPGRGGYGPARELGRFYEALLSDRLLRPATRAVLTQRHRIGMFDETFRHVMDWGLGFVVNSGRYGAETVPYGFGRYASEETFGHGGAQSSMAFCDPVRQLVVAWICDGMCGEPRHHERNRELNTAIYEALGMT
ncbi:MAG: serine hydrolase domain-containing protein [Verrucomicrobiae bacterium]|nr:serine hydrolase domain-containing protein [Verrucomicrobiae bacterium]